jgi:hypothetical protein
MLEERLTLLVCAAAAGADLLALDVASELGIKCHVILPYDPPIFCERSVRDRGEYWVGLFDKLLPPISAQGGLTVLNLSLENDDAAYRETNQMLVEEARRKAHGGSAIIILVWEGQSRGRDDFTGLLQSLGSQAGMRERVVMTRHAP